MLSGWLGNELQPGSINSYDATTGDYTLSLDVHINIYILDKLGSENTLSIYYYSACMFIGP